MVDPVDPSIGGSEPGILDGPARLESRPLLLPPSMPESDTDPGAECAKRWTVGGCSCALDGAGGDVSLGESELRGLAYRYDGGDSVSRADDGDGPPVCTGAAETEGAYSDDELSRGGLGMPVAEKGPTWGSDAERGSHGELWGGSEDGCVGAGATSGDGPKAAIESETDLRRLVGGLTDLGSTVDEDGEMPVPESSVPSGRAAKSPQLNATGLAPRGAVSEPQLCVRTETGGRVAADRSSDRRFLDGRRQLAYLPPASSPAELMVDVDDER